MSCVPDRLILRSRVLLLKSIYLLKYSIHQIANDVNLPPRTIISMSKVCWTISGIIIQNCPLAGIAGYALDYICTCVGEIDSME